MRGRSSLAREVRVIDYPTLSQPSINFVINILGMLSILINPTG
jgi:hypothetical protein